MFFGYTIGWIRIDVIKYDKNRVVNVGILYYNTVYNTLTAIILPIVISSSPTKPSRHAT